MFLKRLLAIATRDETLVYTTRTYKMYDTLFEDRRATKLVLAQSVAPYVFLRRIKHDTIMCLYRLNVEKRTLTTKRLVPFDMVLRKETKEFNRYILLKLAQALEFLHRQCGVVHGNVSRESLFFGEDGGIVLGGFERSRSSSTFDEDGMMFSNLVGDVLGLNASLVSFLENRGFCSDLFFDLEVTFFGYRSFTTEQKLEFISSARRNRDEFIDIHKRRIGRMVVADLSGDVSKEFKISVVDFVLNFDISDMEEFLPPLFSVLDTDVRLHLLRNQEKYTGSVESLDPIVKSLSLGIKCKDRQLREETMYFIRENMGMISKRQQAEVLETMYGYVSDEVGVQQVLGFLCATRPVFKKSDVVYRILCRYLLQSKCKPQVLVAMEVFYKDFDKFRMTTELLPLLCGYLSDSTMQVATFSLIEKILQHLKEHKGEIVDNEWRIGSIRSIFGLRSRKKKEDKPTQTQEHVDKPCHPGATGRESSENDDGWDEPW